jgi:hypothetical protein
MDFFLNCNYNKQRNLSLEFWKNDSPNLIYKIINNNSNISNFSTITNYEIDDENKYILLFCTKKW